MNIVKKNQYLKKVLLLYIIVDVIDVFNSTKLHFESLLDYFQTDGRKSWLYDLPSAPPESGAITFSKNLGLKYVGFL